MTYQDDLYHIYSLNLPWSKLNNSNILVTGATGLIGSCIIDVLMRHPSRTWSVYACGRNLNRAKTLFMKYWDNDSFHFVRHDICNQIESNVQYEYMIHAASNASPNYFVQKPVEVIKANVFGVSNLYEYGLNHGLKRILYISSGEVYGEGDGRVFDEDYSGYVNPLCVRSCYPSSKRAAETLCISYSTEYDIESVIARPCHVYGPYFTESDNRVYAQFIRNILRNEDIVMKSTGEQYRSWCYVVDCVAALMHILLLGKNNNAYNIADDSSNITIRSLAEMIAEIGGKKVVIAMPSDIEKSGFNVVKKSLFSIEKLKSLGWRVEGTMEEKMRRTMLELI
ncbi:MAG: NAD-dependent epimerase/dehydratase family protein [Bacteroides sp.]